MELPVMPREFDPTKEELIIHHLRNRIKQIPTPNSCIIPVRIYEVKEDPWESFSLDDDRIPWQPVMDSLGNELPDCYRFFGFTKLTNTGKTMKSKSIQKKRSAGCGTWHGTSKQHEVKGDTIPGEPTVGNYRVLTFRPANEKKSVGQWTIYEYTIDPRCDPEIERFDDWADQVVCEIRRDGTKYSVGGKVHKVKVEKEDDFYGEYEELDGDKQIDAAEYLNTTLML